MTSLIKKCFKCGRYTLKETCRECKVKTRVAHPVKYSPDDKYRFYKSRMIEKFAKVLATLGDGDETKN